MLRFVLLLCVVALVNGRTTPVNQCTVNSAPLPINTYIEGCDSLPCELPQLQDAIIHIIYRAPETIHRMRTLATAYLPGMFPIPYPLLANAETCNFLTNTYCPVMQGEVIQYTLRMYIQQSFQVVQPNTIAKILATWATPHEYRSLYLCGIGVQPEIEFRIQDNDRNRDIVCIRAPLRIVEAINSRTGAKNGTVIDLA